MSADITASSTASSTAGSTPSSTVLSSTGDEMASPTELKTYWPSAQSVAGAHVQGMAAYQALADEAERDYAGFWARQARELLSW